MVINLDSLIGGISSIYTETIILNEPFIVFASRFAEDSGTVILLSDNITDCSKYNILGYDPWLHFYGKHHKMNITTNKNSIEFKANPFEVLKHLLKICSINKIKLNSPIESGLMGYLTYDLKNALEKLPSTTIDDVCLPDICLFIPSIIVVQDILKNNTQLFVSTNKLNPNNTKDIALKNFKKKLSIPTNIGKFYSYDENKNKSNLTHTEYVNAVKKIKKYISEGDVYQVNMSQRFDVIFKGSGFAFFKAIYDINPAPFFAYINAGNHQIVSTSPERLIMRNKNKVEARPIKGTRPRGQTSKTDNLMKDELLNSRKDDAELSMIVDLLRNDLGKVCQANSINLKQHKRLEAYHNVYHLVSIIQGKLDNQKDSVDLIKAVFPGGSITGCPKVRSMEIIDELEVNHRHVYTGSIGYISFHDTMDLSVAIRTATIHNSRVKFSVGGGIVYDSDPEDEFNETLHKGQTIMNVFDKTNETTNQNINLYMPLVWFNGIIRTLNSVNIPISDLGLIYGFGFFETLLTENRTIHLLDEHIKRFELSWNRLFQTPIPKLTWRLIINQVLEANSVNKQTVAIKIIATRGQKIDKFSFNGSILVTAKSYKHRLKYSNRKGLNVGIYSEPRETPIAAHKTLNHLYYHLAGIWATNNSFDEAIILNPDGTISEGNSSNILLIYGKTVVKPKSKFVLPGIMISAVINQLKKMDYQIITRPIKPIELFSTDALFLTNSLMKILPVVSVNNQPINYDPKVVKIMTKASEKAL